MDDDYGKTRMRLERPRRGFAKEAILSQQASKTGPDRRGNQIAVIQGLPTAPSRTYNCIQQFQLGETGKCVDAQNQVATLVCCKVVEQDTGAENPTERFIWAKRERCSN